MMTQTGNLEKNKAVPSLISKLVTWKLLLKMNRHLVFIGVQIKSLKCWFLQCFRLFRIQILVRMEYKFPPCRYSEELCTDSTTSEGGTVLLTQNSGQDQGVNWLLMFWRFLSKGATCLWWALVLRDPLMSKSAWWEVTPITCLALQ